MAISSRTRCPSAFPASKKVESADAKPICLRYDPTLNSLHSNPIHKFEDEKKQLHMANI